MKIVKTIIFVLFALVFIAFGLDKFLHYIPVPEMPAEMQKVFDALMTLKWVAPLAGTIEVLSGILILFPKTRALGALMIFPVLIGILAHNITFMPEGLVMAGVLFLIDLWMIADNWTKIKPLFS